MVGFQPLELNRFSHLDNAILEPSKLKLILVTFMMTCGKMTAKVHIQTFLIQFLI